MSDINQVLWERSISLLTSTTVFNDGDGVSIDNRVINVVFELLQQLQQARREGWEQCQREAQTIVEQSQLATSPLQIIRLRIPAMEYKEPTK